MKIDMTRGEKGTADIIVELSVEEMQPYLEQAARHLSEHKTVPGFRPGKAPYAVMVKAVGEAALLEAAFEPTIRGTLPKALAEKKLTMVGTPKVDPIKLAPGNPLIYKAVVPLLPDVTLGDIRSLKVERKKIQVEESAVDKLLERLRKSRAKESLADRQAHTGDKVDVAFTAYLDKVPVEGGSAQPQPVMIGENRFVPGFEEQLVGLKAGEQKDFTIRFPNDYYQKNLAGRDVEFRVKVHAVYDVELPDMSDVFASSFGPYKTVAELRDHLRKNIEEERKQEERERFEHAMLDKILSISSVGELPDAIVDGEITKMVEELKDSLVHQGMEYDKYLASVKKSEDDLKNEFRTKAEQRLRLALITRAIAETEKIEVPDAEVQKEVDATKKIYEGNAEVQKSLSSSDYFSYLKNTLSSKKVYELLDSLIGMDEKG